MIDDKLGQGVRICGAPGCGNPLGKDSRRRYCSTICAVKVNRLRSKQGQAELRGVKQSDKTCEIEGCENLIPEGRRRYCSDGCAAKAQKEQVRKTSERLREDRGANPKRPVHIRETRTVRGMQQVPADRWDEYVFNK